MNVFSPPMALVDGVADQAGVRLEEVVQSLAGERADELGGAVDFGVVKGGRGIGAGEGLVARDGFVAACGARGKRAFQRSRCDARAADGSRPRPRVLRRSMCPLSWRRPARWVRPVKVLFPAMVSSLVQWTSPVCASSMAFTPAPVNGPLTVVVHVASTKSRAAGPVPDDPAFGSASGAPDVSSREQPQHGCAEQRHRHQQRHRGGAGSRGM